jgi:hypothetical protein
MRAYEIALFLALFTAIGGVVNELSFMNEYELTFDEVGYSFSDFDNIDGKITTGQIVGSDESLAASDTKLGITSLLSAIKKLDDYVFIKTIIMDIFASKLIPESPEYIQINNIANIIQTGCIFVYMFAIVQLWRNSSIKHME